MENIFYLQESNEISTAIDNIRKELTDAIGLAIAHQMYNTDVQLSFGLVHINSRGSISAVSFNGLDITDIDEFVVEQALNIDNENYFDIRKIIKENIDDFCFYPILIKNHINYTVLKSSPYFERKYGAMIHDASFKVEYASKYLIIHIDGRSTVDVYFVGTFNPIHTANLLLKNAYREIGGKTEIYYCFMNSRPEHFLHLGTCKEDFIAYKPQNLTDLYNFYKGSILSGVYKMNKKTDDNGKVLVKETNIKCLRMIIEMQYGNITNFCEFSNLNQIQLNLYLTGLDSKLSYNNGNILTPTRLCELLNLPFKPTAENLKDKNLLIKVNYDDIPTKC